MQVYLVVDSAVGVKMHNCPGNGKMRRISGRKEAEPNKSIWEHKNSNDKREPNTRLYSTLVSGKRQSLSNQVRYI